MKNKISKIKVSHLRRLKADWTLQKEMINERQDVSVDIQMMHRYKNKKREVISRALPW